MSAFDYESHYARRRAAASYYRAHRASYRDVCQIFNVPSFDVNDAPLSHADRIVVWLLEHEPDVILFLAGALGVGLVLLLELLTHRA